MKVSIALFFALASMASAQRQPAAPRARLKCAPRLPLFGSASIWALPGVSSARQTRPSRWPALSPEDIFPSEDSGNLLPDAISPPWLAAQVHWKPMNA